MRAAPIGHCEHERLAQLRALEILDTPPEEAFDRLVRLASRTTGAPAAAISLVDGERVWLKAQVGLPGNQIPSDKALCAECMLGGGPLVVEDAAQDARFRDGVLVRDLGIRFYAGTPLRCPDGFPIGTVCVLGDQPRGVTPDEMACLEELASMASELIRLRRDEKARDRLREALDRSNNQRALLAEVAARTDNAVIITDPAGRIEWVNTGYTRITEYTLEESLGRKPGELLQGPGTDAGTVAHMSDRLKQGEGFEVEILNYAKSGRAYWLATEVRPLRDDAGRITNFIAIERDITEDKRHQIEIERQKNTIESVLNTCMEGVVMFRAVRDSDGVLVDLEYLLVNSSAERILGRGADELLGKQLLECFPNHRDTGLIDTISRVIETGEPCVNEYDYKDRGINGWFRNSIARLDDGVVITFSDLTEQKRSQREIERSNERFLMVTEATEDIVWDYDIVTGVIWWGGNLRANFGHDLPDDRCTIDEWTEWVHPDDRAAVMDSFEAALDGDASRWSSEYRFRRADGGYASVLDRACIIRDEHGRAVRVVGAAIDLTERRESAERLALQASLLEAQSDASPDAILVTDPDGRVIRANARMRALAGAGAAGLIGLDGREVLGRTLTGSSSVDRFLTRIRAGDVTLAREFRETIGVPDGRWFQVIAEPLEAAGPALGWVWFVRDVTKSRRDEQILRQHNLVVENSKVVLFRWRPEPGWPVELVSENIDQFGYNSDDLLSSRVRFAELVHPDDLERVAAEVEGHLASGAHSFEQEYRILCKDGRVRWTLDRTVVDRDPDGRVVSLQGVVVDIDDRKRAEEALHLAQQKLHSIAAQVPGAVYQFRRRPDGASEITYISDGVRDLFDITPEQVYKDASLIRSMVPDEERDAFDRSVDESAEQLTPWKHEFRVVLAVGRTLTIGGRSVPQREPDGSVLWHGIMVDLTEQKRSREIQQRLTNALERTNSIAHVGSWELDPAAMELWWSDEVHRIHGLEPGEPPRLDDAIGFYREDARPVIISAVERGLQTGEPWDLELPMIRADGREIWVHTQGEVVMDNGRPVLLRGAIQDITESHLARQQLAQRAEELERLRDQAEAANRAKSEFIANMSHEIRTPLTSILGYTELIRDGDDKAESADWRRTTAQTILAAGDHLMTVINDILDISKIEAGRMSIEPEPTDLACVVREAVRISSVRADAKRVRLAAEVAPGVPDRVVADPTRLRQILMNLLGNAVKFTDSGSVTVRIAPSDDAGRLLIDVEDTGPGIDDEQRSRLFCMFSQADTSLTRRHGGTGLGLVLSKRFANLMGGDVNLLWSRAGEGSCFRLELPLNAVAGANQLTSLDAPRTTPATPAATTDKPAERTLRGRILLAEDGPDNQRLITFHLRKGGAEVDIAENGAVALAMIATAEAEGRPYDLLLTDIQMPEMDGHALAKALRESGSDLPIVALTAHAMPEDRQRCVDAGCDDYATKPIDRATLIETCARWMERRHRPNRTAA